jgi:hypothetical protein
VNTHVRAPAAALALVLGLAAQGCREGVPATTAGAIVARSITPKVDVAQDGAFAVVTLALDLRGDVGRIGSYTGRLLFDASALTFDTEVSPVDGTERASNPGAGVIRVAGAAVNGVNVAALAAFRFKVVNAAALQAVRLELDEVHEISRADLKALVRRPPAALPFGVRP